MLRQSRKAFLPLGASAGAALVLMLVRLALEPGGDLLLGLNQNVQQIFGYVAVFVVKERRGLTCTTQHRALVSLTARKQHNVSSTRSYGRLGGRFFYGTFTRICLDEVLVYLYQFGTYRNDSLLQ